MTLSEEAGIRTELHQADLCVVGGGMAGLCAALAAARHGIRVVLMQDRPVLGGNASSEIRMWVCGANGQYDRESGIIEELFLENYYRNQSLSFSVWDSVLYGKACYQENLELLLNCSCQQAEMDGASIRSVTGWQLTTQTCHKVCASFFADCSGDSILAPLTGARFMLGREAKADYGEKIPPDKSDRKTMGMSCLFQIRETDRPQKYIPPDWAYDFPTDADLPFKDHGIDNNFWWIELGGDRDSIRDTEFLRDELMRIAFGVWDHMKNHGNHGADNWQLDWVGFLPGKRESRRYLGDYVINQNDVEAGGRFPDVVAYAGWSMDDHFPEGFCYTKGYPTIFHPAPSPWGIPFRSLYSRNIENLLFAGRNISVTHAALSSSRVMATCGVIGQAVGTAVAQLVHIHKRIREIDIDRLQQTLMYDDCYIPYVQRRLSSLTQQAQTGMPVLKNGRDRNFAGQLNSIAVQPGTPLIFQFVQPVFIKEVRIVFDSNLERDYDNMPCRYPLREEKYRIPASLVKSYRLMAQTQTGEILIADIRDNRKRFVLHLVNQIVSSIRLIPLETYGEAECRIFSMDVQ